MKVEALLCEARNYHLQAMYTTVNGKALAAGSSLHCEQQGASRSRCQLFSNILIPEVRFGLDEIDHQSPALWVVDDFHRDAP